MAGRQTDSQGRQAGVPRLQLPQVKNKKREFHLEGRHRLIEDEQTEKKVADLWPSLQRFDHYTMVVTGSGSTNYQTLANIQICAAATYAII